MTKKNLFAPDIIIPGFPKSGTSSLYNYLTNHPKIAGGKEKEPHIYSYNSRFKGRFQNTSERNFISQFNGLKEECLKIEASTTYMISPFSAERIHFDNPNCKLIIIARDPIERVLSHYNWLRSLGIENQEFIKAISDWIDVKFEPKNNFGGNYKYYTEFSKYGEQLERFLKYFKKDQIFFLTLEELKRDKSTSLNNIYNYLGLNCIDLSTHSIVNKTKRKAKVYTTPAFIKTFTKYIPLNIRSKLRQSLLPNMFSKVVTSHISNEEEETFIYKILEQDLKKLEELGFKSAHWQTVEKIERMAL